MTQSLKTLSWYAIYICLTIGLISYPAQTPTLLLDQIWVDFVDLGYADRRRFPHVRIGVLTAPPQRFEKIFDDLVEPDATHGANRQRTNEGVHVLCVLAEGIHGEQSQLRLCPRVVDDVQVHLGGGREIGVAVDGQEEREKTTDLMLPTIGRGRRRPGSGCGF